MITYCFTGHRPDKLGGYNWNNIKNQKIIFELKKLIINQLKISNEKDFTFICGGALGIDQMAFEIVYDLKTKILKSTKININIYIVLAMPFEKQSDNWFNKDKDRLNSQKERADKFVLVDTIDGYKFQKAAIGEYAREKMQLRNQYMVDNSDIVIAVWNGSNGGTANCVNYAHKLNKQIIIINPI